MVVVLFLVNWSPCSASTAPRAAAASLEMADTTDKIRSR